MKVVLVSLISDYLIPNFLLIKECEGKYDELLFLSTERMEKRDQRKRLEKALGLEENSVPYILVSDDDYYNNMDQFRDLELLTDDTEYVVNLTGGTKMMSLAVYEYFKKSPESIFCYVPLGKNVICYTDRDSQEELHYRINLKEYFLLHGITFEAKDHLTYPEETTNSLFNKVRSKNFILKNIFNIRNAQNLIDNKDKVYYSGGWFEEYVYSRLKKEFSLSDEFIATGARIFRPDIEVKQNNNEIDVMFVYNNNLYIFECKVGMKGNRILNAESANLLSGMKDNMLNYLYKLVAISQDYGLHVNSYLCTLENFNLPKTITDGALIQMRNRAKILRINNIFDCNVFALSGNLIKKPTVDFSELRWFKEPVDLPSFVQKPKSENFIIVPQITIEEPVIEEILEGVCESRSTVKIEGYENAVPLKVKKIYRDEIIGKKIKIRSIQKSSSGKITQAEHVPEQ